MYHVDPPHTFSACKTAALGAVADSSSPDTKQIIMKLRVIWGNAEAQQLKRVSVDSDGETMGLLHQCDVYRTFDKAPHLAIAGASQVSSFNKELQADSPFLGDTNAPGAMDVPSKCSPLIQARPENPVESRNAFCSSWIAILGRPKRIQMDEGG